METINKQRLDELLKSEEFLLVDFYADWCGPCKMMAPVLQRVAAKMPEIKIVKVDADVHTDLVAEYQILTIPTMKFFKDGIEKFEQFGFIAEPKLIALLEDNKI